MASFPDASSSGQDGSIGESSSREDTSLGAGEAHTGVNYHLEFEEFTGMLRDRSSNNSKDAQSHSQSDTLPDRPARSEVLMVPFQRKRTNPAEWRGSETLPPLYPSSNWACDSEEIAPTNVSVGKTERIALNIDLSSPSATDICGSGPNNFALEGKGDTQRRRSRGEEGSAPPMVDKQNAEFRRHATYKLIRPETINRSGRSDSDSQRHPPSSSSKSMLRSVFLKSGRNNESPRGAAKSPSPMSWTTGQSQPASFYRAGSSVARMKRATREIAALDFLLNIPMKNEAKMLQGPQLAEQPKAATTVKVLSSPSDKHEPITTPANLDGHVPGRRLVGKEATVIRFPIDLRYHLMTKYPAQSTVISRWEAGLLMKGLHDGRIFFSSAQGYPGAVFSVIKYETPEELAHKRKSTAVVPEESKSNRYDWRGKSYFQLLHATWTRCGKERDSRDPHPIQTIQYDWKMLDDPDIRQGKHRQVIRGDRNIGPVMTSILLFVRAEDLKEELNKTFREKHPGLNPGITLSKIRKLKHAVLSICVKIRLNVATAALACLYFEKLVLKNVITKQNRHLYMACCLLLAFKFNEPLSSPQYKLYRRKLLEDIDRVFAVSANEVLLTEFNVWAALSFELHVKLSELQGHFNRLLKMIDSNPERYLSKEMLQHYTDTLYREQGLPVNAVDDEEAEEDEDEVDYGGEDGDDEDEDADEGDEDKRSEHADGFQQRAKPRVGDQKQPFNWMKFWKNIP